ncbi:MULTISPECIES: hypothetical protein [unclassified Pigmentiphaga]|uniref:hypothetical protein n=1 Tax=unclassified Pigmentiphaga TaxID=2626614 RepID=UPI000B422495|nr:MULTISPECIES: hypothetical protein [unclassified Pigmentiphaga]OVZ65186.1 hypothetical protein CDO46_07275 [Pigmentiphaga sp. NML030171]
MKNVLKKYGLIGGTAAACAACCPAPLFMGPLLAWTGATTLGLVFSPWFLLLLAVPGLLMLARKIGKHTPQPSPAAPGGCGSSATSAPDEGKKHGCQ